MYPQQYQDLLDFLDSNPQYLHEMRVRLLSPELIALPEQFAQLVSVVAELSDRVAQLTDRFNAFVEATDRRLTSLEEHAVTTNGRLSVLEEHAVTTNRRLTSLEGDVHTLKNDVAALKGSDTERRARENILNIAKDELNLTRGRILLARGQETAPQFLAAIDRAEERGLITVTEADNVLVADIIIRARRASDRQFVHGVFEVSRTIRRSDIQRAHDRAATLATATGEEAIAAVIGEFIQPQQQVQADDIGVKVLIPAMFRQEEEDPSDDPAGHIR